MTLAEKLKVNLDLWNLFIAIVSLSLTYQVRIMTLASTIFKKSTFQRKFPFKSIRMQIWPWRLVGQGQLRIIIWTNLVGPTSPMLHTKSQGHRPSCSGEEDFERVFTIYGRGGHLGHVTKIFCIHFSYLIIRSLHMKFEFNWANSLWENYVFIYWWDSNMSDFAERSKVNLDLWNLFIAIVSLG